MDVGGGFFFHLLLVDVEMVDKQSNVDFDLHEFHRRQDDLMLRVQCGRTCQTDSTLCHDEIPLEQKFLSLSLSLSACFFLQQINPNQSFVYISTTPISDFYSERP